ncbi:hypothetical protein D3C72_1265800 [compost metagenome]
MHAGAVIDDQVVAQRVVLGVIDEKTTVVAGHHVVFDQRVLDGAQHDAVIGIAPRDIAAHGQAAHLHQRQPGPAQIYLVVFPGTVVGVHVVRAVADMMDAVVAKLRVARDVDIDAVARAADFVAGDARSARVVHLDAIAALRRLQVAPAGDGVVQQARIVNALQPDAEQVGDQSTVVDLYAMRARHDINAGVLRSEVRAAVDHDQADQGDVGGGDADGVAVPSAADGGMAAPLQRQRLVDQHVFVIPAGCDQQCVAFLRTGDGRIDRHARRHFQHGGGQARPIAGQYGCQHQRAHQRQQGGRRQPHASSLPCDGSVERKLSSVRK